MTYCTHYDCRCEAAEDLAWMADVLNRPDLLRLAVEIHSCKVRCCHVPRRSATGSATPPFAEKEGVKT